MKSTQRLARLVALLGLLGASCRTVEGPNVVLITLDTTRADRLGAMGYEKAKTPILDGLAARGAIFERAYTGVPITLPSHTTILTGLDPHRHGVHNNGSFIVPNSLETVAERLKARGYETGAFLSAFVLDAAFGLNQGFDTYDAEMVRDFEPPVVIIPLRDATQTTDRALGWLKNERKRPYFVWVHYFDVHQPRRVPDAFKKIPGRYDAALAYVDSEVGRLLEGVKAATPNRETLIIVAGDHGESLGQHNERSHGNVAYDATLHVPLIVAGPAFAAGTRSKVFAKTADVTPTILTAVGEPVPADLDGRALQARLNAPSDAKDEEIAYFETMLPAIDHGWARLAGVRTERWKLTAEPDPIELYDVVADPLELENRAPQEADVVARLSAKYREMRPETVTESAPVPDAVAEKLAALGYVSQPQTVEAKEKPDPRQGVVALAFVEDARALLYEGRIADSLEALRLFAQSPIAGPIALRQLAPLYVRIGRYEDAVDAYGKLAAMADNAQVRLHLAGALMLAGRPADALTLIDEIERSSPERAPLLHLTRTRALLAAGEPEKAIEEAGRGLADDPWNDSLLALESAARARGDEVAEIGRLQKLISKAPESATLIETRGVLADMLHRRGRDREAREVLETVKEPPLEQRALLADIVADRGDVDRAIKIYEEIIEMLPEGTRYARSLARLYAAAGRHPDALRMFDRVIAANPKDAPAHVGRGAEYFRLGKLAEAEKDYREALALDEGLPEVSFNLALLLLRKDDKTEAEKWLLKAVERRPEYAKAHYQLARIYHDRKDPRAALHAEKAAAASASSSARSALLRGAGKAAPKPAGAKPESPGGASHER